MISGILFSLPLDGGAIGWGCSGELRHYRKKTQTEVASEQEEDRMEHLG